MTYADGIESAMNAELSQVRQQTEDLRTYNDVLRTLLRLRVDKVVDNDRRMTKYMAVNV